LVFSFVEASEQTALFAGVNRKTFPYERSEAEKYLTTL
jgi:hypothetical protein